MPWARVRWCRYSRGRCARASPWYFPHIRRGFPAFPSSPHPLAPPLQQYCRPIPPGACLRCDDAGQCPGTPGWGAALFPWRVRAPSIADPALSLWGPLASLPAVGPPPSLVLRRAAREKGVSPLPAHRPPLFWFSRSRYTEKTAADAFGLETPFCSCCGLNVRSRSAWLLIMSLNVCSS